jgi:FMN phosphatase YigB (HAD superfamily)
MATATTSKTVFLFDVDNTLLDNDRVTADLKKHLNTQVGVERASSYWQIFETLRTELGYADYLGALQRYRIANPHEPNLLEVSYFLLNYSFANRLYPGSLDAVEHVETAGPTVILSDGDVVFQPHKVRRSGLHEEFNGRVLIYVHKEKELADVEARFPAGHYVLVDDKIRILTAVKQGWGDRVTTVFVRQGHYALDPDLVAKYPAADVMIERIGDLATCEIDRLVAPTRS